MKKNISKYISAIFALILMVLCLTVSVSAANADIFDSLSFITAEDDANTEIKTQTGISGDRYLLLPSSADMTGLVLYFDGGNAEIKADKGTLTIESGVAFDLTTICTPVNGEYRITVSGKNLIVMKSENIRALFYVSDDPVNAGRPFVDAVKGNEAEGKMSLVGADGEVDYTDKVSEIKARGNSTFTKSPKKAYQFKLKNKTDLINNNPEEACKKWVLLANMFDATMVHNSITFRLAADLNMPYTSHFEQVDLYFDGEYRGTYLLCEKVDIDDSKVEIDNTDDLIEEVNEDTDAYKNPVVTTATTQSKGSTSAAANSKGSYKYVKGLIEPAFPEGADHHAYLLELEFYYRYPDELTGFVTNKGQCIVTKNPEYLTKESGAYISAFWQEFEDAVYSTNGYNSKTGKYYYDYCDLESLVKVYLINELSKNVDGFISSSFFYLPADEDIMYAGPIWDYDPCYGPGGFHDNIQQTTANPENFYMVKNYLINGLIKHESFRNAVKEQLNKENGEFYLAVQNMIGDDGYVYTFSEEIAASRNMNAKMWKVMDEKFVVVHKGDAVTFENATIFLNDYIDTRVNWLADTVSTWNGNSYSLPLDPEPEEPKDDEPLSFFEQIIAFFQSIIDWFMNLFK